MKADNILINIRKILRSVNLESKRIQKEYGVSIPQLLTLGFLNNQPEYKATHKQVSAYLNLNNSTITGIISRLEKKSYLVRVQSPEDRRVSYITLTALGQQLLTKAPMLMHQRLTKKIEDSSPQKLNELQKAIDLVIDFMGIESIEASPVITDEELSS